MRSALYKSYCAARWIFFVLAMGAFVSACWSQQTINPHTQIRWPAGCAVYNVSANACPPVGSIVFKGAWSSSTTYAANDAVSISGSTYVSLQNSNLNHNPTSSPTFWALLVAGGTLPTAAVQGQMITSTAPGNTYAIQPNIFWSQSGDTIASIEAECTSPCSYHVTVAQTITLSGNHTLSSNVLPVFEQGGNWTVNGAFTLTIGSGYISAAPGVRVFAGTSTIAGLKVALPDWFAIPSAGVYPSSALLAAYNATVVYGEIDMDGSYTSPWQTISTPLLTYRKFVGKKRPLFDNQATPTLLQNGTRILGTFYLNTAIWAEHFGVDVGSAFATCTNTSGSGNGFYMANDGHLALGSYKGVHLEDLSVLTCGTPGNTGHGFLVENADFPIVKDIYVKSPGALFSFVWKSSNGFGSNLNWGGSTSEGFICKSDYATSQDGNCQGNTFDGMNGEFLSAGGASQEGALIDGRGDFVQDNRWTNVKFSGVAVGYRVQAAAPYGTRRETYSNIVCVSMTLTCFNANLGPVTDVVVNNAIAEINASSPGVNAFAVGDTAKNIRFNNLIAYSSNGSTMSGFLDQTNSGTIAVVGMNCHDFTGFCAVTSNDQAHPLIASGIVPTNITGPISGPVFDVVNNFTVFKQDIYSDGVGVRCYTSYPCTPFTFYDTNGNPQCSFYLGIPGNIDCSDVIADHALNLTYLSNSKNPLCYFGSTATNVGCGPVSNAITSATGGAGTGAVTCLTAACTNLRGSYTVAGGTFATGTLLTLVWPTTTTAYACHASVLNSATGASIGYHSVATATGMTISSLTAATGLTVDIDYSCEP